MIDNRALFILGGPLLTLKKANFLFNKRSGTNFA